MGVLLLVVSAMGAAVLVVGMGDRLRLPWPALMLLVGVGAAALPGVGSLQVDPDLVLPLLLPPLLFAAAQRTSWAQFREGWRAVLLRAGVLTAVTIAAAAATLVAVVPALTATAAVAVAAAVAPPDPVAVDAVSATLRLPQRLLSALRSEGLFNDAVSLVVFQTALSALAAGRSFGPRVVLGFSYGLVVAVLLGLAAAWLAGWVRSWLTDVAGRNALTLVLPFAVYLAAEELSASGVIAVVVLALQMGARQEPDAGEDRLSGGAFWDVVELLATGIAFGLVGVELRLAVAQAGSALPAMLGHAGLVCAVLVGLRLAWMLAASPLIRRRGAVDAAPRTAREAVVLAWCGMRGLVTLALALALPVTVAGGEPFPARTEVIVIAGSVIVVTLLVPSFTLRPLVEVLGVTERADAERAAERPIAQRAMSAAAEAVRHPSVRAGDDAQAADRAAASLGELSGWLGDEDDSEDYARRRDQLRARRDGAVRVQRAALDAARAEVLAARRQPGVDPEAADRVLRRLDQRTAALGTAPVRR